MGSTAPVFVVPAFALTRNGRRSAARSASIAAIDVPRTQPEVVIRRQDAQLVRPEPEVACGSRDRRVGLIAGVHHDPRRHRADERLSCARDRGEVRGRSAGHQDARRRLRVFDPVAEPVEDGQLEGARSGGFAPRAGVDHGRRSDQVAEGGRPRAGAGDVAEEPRMIEVADERQDVLVQDAGAARRSPAGRSRVARPGARASIRGCRSAGPVRPEAPSILAMSMSTTASPISRICFGPQRKWIGTHPYPSGSAVIGQSRSVAGLRSGFRQGGHALPGVRAGVGPRRPLTLATISDRTATSPYRSGV